MEVNEKIVEEYIKRIKKWFYMTDISFPVAHNYSNIDLLAYDHLNNIYYDMEIKYRSAYKLTKKHTKVHDDLIYQLIRPERKEAIEKIINNEKNVVKLYVTTKTHFGTDGFIENFFISEIKKYGYNCIVWYFDDIIPELYEKINEKGRYNTELTQTIRLVKKYL